MNFAWYSSSTLGTRNASVFPEPVRAAPRTSLPASKGGIVRAWTSVIVSYPIVAMPAIVGFESESDANVLSLRIPSTWTTSAVAAGSVRSRAAASSSSSSSSRAARSSSSSRRASAAANVLRVNARQASVSHKALAHADSVESASLRHDLQRHLLSGGATVLVTPVVDPMIVDLAASDADFFGHDRNSPAGRVLVEGTVCKCDPNDPGDCCARGLATYCVSCPVLASRDCDDGVNGDGGEWDDSFAMDCDDVRDCAFARAIKAASATTTSRHQYYAAVVQTSHGLGGAAATVDEDGRVAEAIGYEEFLVYRPNGDGWIAGAVPPPTSVRRASFGPKLRGEMRTLAVKESIDRSVDLDIV
mmetsp:Transcript_8411/g.30776  ORF Transcript_8411/g.30776 Transcript_8411/m.30776 type:complete len:359 (-) Transcript_8411:150-1226(-)